MNSFKALVATAGGVILGNLFLAAPAQAQIASYCAVISGQDLYTSNGDRLRSVSQIIQQDRANVHKFGKVDSGDDYDSYFHIYERRVALERAVRNSRINSDLKSNILNGNAYICVEFYGNSVSIY